MVVEELHEFCYSYGDRRMPIFQAQPTAGTRGLLMAPTYGYGEVPPRKPSVGEILFEWVDAIAFWRDFSRLPAAAYALYHLATFGVFIAFFVHYHTWPAIVAVMAGATFIATVYNTVWYHRYCSHRAFKFRSLWFARIFLWTNPVCFREESYVIPHRVHHQNSDEIGDPYGPHLGWLGSYLATESQQKMNLELGPEEYDRLVKSLAHIGFRHNSLAAYRRTGSVESLAHYFARVVFANVFWTAPAYACFGWPGVMGWIAGVFFYTFLVRDFNYRGHAGFFFAARKGMPINQVFYGIIAGEWHENHHVYPRSARSGKGWWQLDIPWWIIKGMHFCGLVTQVNPLEQSAPRSAAGNSAVY